jgi:hypothetical protein
MILSNGLLSASQINSLYTFDNLLNASQIKGNFTKNLIGGSLGNEDLLSYIQNLIDSFKTRVANEGGTFEAKDCLFSNLTTLDDYQVDTNAQIVRDYATRVRADGGVVEGFENVITSIKTLNNSDLYEKASLSLFTSGVKAGKAYSILPANGNGDFDVIRSTTKTRTNGAGLIETVAANVPSLNYDKIGGASSLLLEQQRTNLALYSDDFSNPSWFKNVSSVLSDQAVAPNGTFTSDKLIPDSGANVCRLLFNGVNVSAGSLTFSIFVKVIDFNFFFLREDINNTLDNTIFDLTLKTISTLAPGRTASITEYINGYLRIQLTATSPDSFISNLGFGFCNNGTSVSVTGDGVKSGLIWGAQLEQGSYATSYITTQASAVTRLADSFRKNNIFTNNFITSLGGTWFVEFKNNIPLIRDGAGAGLNLTTTGGYAPGLIFKQGGESRIRLIELKSSGSEIQIYITTQTTSNLIIKWDGFSLNVFENGIKVVSNYPFTLSLLNVLDCSGLTTTVNLSSLALFPTPLTDAECITLTTP